MSFEDTEDYYRVSEALLIALWGGYLVFDEVSSLVRSAL